jgi:hypothetical protein
LQNINISTGSGAPFAKRTSVAMPFSESMPEYMSAMKVDLETLYSVIFAIIGD